jgi:hypothetical protein
MLNPRFFCPAHNLLASGATNGDVPTVIGFKVEVSSIHMLEFRTAFDSNDGSLLAAVVGLSAIEAHDSNIISVLSDRAVGNGGRKWRLSKISMSLTIFRR